MLLSVKLVQAAIAAIATINFGVQATSEEDKAAYPEFAAAMQKSGSDFGWNSYKASTSTGYDVLLYRITQDATGAALEETLGPILLQHGMFSDPTEWLAQTDPNSPSLPIQLAQVGYDVWIGLTRGRPYTKTESNKTSGESYWNYSYEEIGLEDYSAMIDQIIATRNAINACKKITLVTHGTGANSALVAASLDQENFASKVSQVVNLGPCLNIDLDDYWCPLRVLSSIESFYGILKDVGVKSLYGPLGDDLSFCKSSSTFESICQTYIYDDLDNPLYKGSSLKEFEHLSQNSSLLKFRAYFEYGQESADYPIDQISTVPFHAIMSQTDVICPTSLSRGHFDKIPTGSKTLLDGFDHLQLISNNSSEFTRAIFAALTSQAEKIASESGICPEPDTDPNPDPGPAPYECNGVIYDPVYIEQEKTTLMTELDGQKQIISRYESSKQKRNSCRIIQDLEAIIAQFDNLCIDYGESVDTYDGYAYVIQKCTGSGGGGGGGSGDGKKNKGKKK